MENDVLKLQVIVTFETSSLHVLLSQLKLMCLIIRAHTLMILWRLGQSWAISFSFTAVTLASWGVLHLEVCMQRMSPAVSTSECFPCHCSSWQRFEPMPTPMALSQLPFALKEQKDPFLVSYLICTISPLMPF